VDDACRTRCCCSGFNWLKRQNCDDVMPAIRPDKARLNREQERKKQAENATDFEYRDFLV
jgi:hypothetical protein